MENLQIIEPKTEKQLKEVVTKLNRDQILWLGGYLAATLNYAKVESAPQLVNINGAESVSSSLTILYGSQTGNSLKVAELAHKEALSKGLNSKLLSMDEYKPRAINSENQLLVVVSTHGEGEPPTAALEFHEALQGKRINKLSELSYSVIALGDSSYINFCQTGIDFHSFLKEKQAKPLQEPLLLDTDFENHIPTVLPKIISKFLSVETAASPQSTIQHNQVVGTEGVVGEGQVEIVEKIQLNGKGSNKETWHIEFAAEASNIEYLPGDSIEVYASNHPDLVRSILKQINLNATEKVDFNGQETTLEEALLYHFEITLITPKVLKNYATLLSNDELNLLLDDAKKMESFLYGTDLLDLVTNYKADLTASKLLEILRPLSPRAYSIASCPEESEGEIHITVGAVRYNKNGRERGGVCSTFLSDRTDVGENLKVRVKPNLQFRLPKDPSKAIIMIGAGTGIAPYRSFLQNRSITGATGKNWLFFGDQHFTTDFLYQSEILKYRKDGLLTKLDVAFSRDQEEKIYVQNQLLNNGKEVWNWLQDGSHIYICGDRKKMAKDVKNALLEIFSEHGKLTAKESEDLLLQLKKDKRFQEDVY